jgi:hypothetical protein
MRWMVMVAVATMGCERSARKATSDLSCTPKRHVLHVRSIPPTDGEQLRYEESVIYRIPAVQGAGSHFETSEAVISVRNDQPEEREVRFNKGTFQGPGMNAPVELTGKVIRIRIESNKSVYLENGQPVAPNIERVVEAYDRHDVGQSYWMMRLVTDRTIRVGVETAVKLERGVGDDPTDARIKLRALDATTATFDIKVRAGSPPLTAHGEAIVDITRSRPIAVDLTAEFDLPAAEKQQAGLEGTIAVKQRFTYSHAAPDRSPAECSD